MCDASSIYIFYCRGLGHFVIVGRLGCMWEIIDISLFSIFVSLICLWIRLLDLQVESTLMLSFLAGYLGRGKTHTHTHTHTDIYIYVIFRLDWIECFLFFCHELLFTEHKLFIGMLPKGASKADVMAVFSPYGSIKELSVIKGSQPTSKGELHLFCLLHEFIVFRLILVKLSVNEIPMPESHCMSSR